MKDKVKFNEFEEYLGILAKQDHRCAINSAHVEPEEYKGKTDRRRGFWHIDHDHLTGKIRGVLCRTCNTALGAFDDSIEGLTRAVRYLELHYGSSAIEQIEEHW